MRCSRWLALFLVTAISFASAALGQTHNEIEGSEPLGGFPPRTGPSRMIERIIGLSDQPNIRVFQLRPAKPSDVSIFYIHGDHDPASAALQSYPKFGLWTLQQVADHEHANIYAIARPGLYGSAGDYGVRERRSRKTYQMVNTVIDTLIVWEQLNRVSIVGQSGGAAYALAHPLFRKPEPAKCYALAAGSHHLYLHMAFNRQKTLEPVQGPRPPLDFNQRNPERNYTATLAKINAFEPSLHLWSIAPESQHRFIIVGDRRDQVVPFESSEKLAMDLKAHELVAELVPINARDARYHAATGHALQRAAECARALKPSVPKD
jgi:hypothetical protein